MYANMASQFEPENYAELEQETEDTPSRADPRPVYSQPHEWTISTLRDKYERGQIDLQPHYQREYVWELKPELPSRLIESLLLQIPIPPLYFVRLDTGKIEVVDGQQRLTTLIRFVTNQFELQKLQKLSNLNGAGFKDLTERDQEKIMDASIRSIVIDAGTNHDLRYEIFERLNRGAMALNEQEIRNCAYRGPFCDLLSELEKDGNWRKVKGTDTPEPRFIEREMILRFFAFAARIDHYGGNLKKFLNDYMGMYAPNDPARVAELGIMFRQTMQSVYTVFGENASRLYSASDSTRYDTGTWESRFSISALDIQASALIGYSPSKVQTAAKPIFEAYKFYLATNPQVRLAILQRPAGKDATKTRWFGFKTIVQEILSSATLSGVSSEPLFEAKTLFRAGYFSAAGAMAGVVLERHLKELHAKHIPSASASGDTINPLNNALRAAEVYDITQFRRIQIMGDIRNRCGHSVSNPPTREEVWELIEGVGKFRKDYPAQ
jgi:hypothetical protein